MNYVGKEPVPSGVIIVGDTNPVGMIAWFHSPPDGSYLQLNGQIISKVGYPDLWAYAQGFLTADQVANPGLYKSIDANTFALPKLDGLFVRGVGQIDAQHVAAALGVKQSDVINPAVKGSASGGLVASPGGTAFFGTTGGANWEQLGTGSQGCGTETRPANVALVPCVKALRSMLMPSTAMVVASQIDMRAGTANDRVVTPAALTSNYPKYVTFTRDMTLASGPQAVVGVGFKPRSIRFYATGTPGSAVGQTSIGDAIDNGGPINNAHYANGQNIAAGTSLVNNNACIGLYESPSINYLGAVGSFDADGFTMAWTRTGAKTAIATIYALCTP